MVLACLMVGHDQRKPICGVTCSNDQGLFAAVLHFRTTSPSINPKHMFPILDHIGLLSAIHAGGFDGVLRTSKGGMTAQRSFGFTCKLQASQLQGWTGEAQPWNYCS